MTRITNHEFLLHLPLFGARITLLIAALLLAIAPMPASAAGTPDYSLVPKLQEIKEHPPAPDFTLPDPAGNRKSLKDYRGKVVMLAFWASWCPYCREELPQMERLTTPFTR